MQISLKVDDNRAQIQMISPHQHVRAATEAALPVLRTQLAESGIQLGAKTTSVAKLLVVSSRPLPSNSKANAQQTAMNLWRGRRRYASGSRLFTRAM